LEDIGLSHYNLYDLRRQPAGFIFCAKLGPSIAHEAQKINPAGYVDKFTNLTEGHNYYQINPADV